MLQRRNAELFGTMALLLAALTARAQTDSPVQSAARPFGLAIADTVQLAGSDAASTAFQSQELPGLQQLVNGSLAEARAVSNQSTIRLDPSQLRLATDSTVRVYFVGEGAGYHNTLGINTSGVGTSSGNPRLLFPDASSSASYLDPSGNPTRTSSAPLLAGDFVDLGTQSAGTQLDFFLIANGAYGGQNVYNSTNALLNPDRLNHVVALARPDSPFLLIGFEDLYGGGDLDFNDVVIAVEIGTVNVQAMISAPEPASLALFGSFLAVAGYAGYRRGRRA
jgi:hypothetical protein